MYPRLKKYYGPVIPRENPPNPVGDEPLLDENQQDTAITIDQDPIPQPDSQLSTQRARYQRS